MTAQDVATLNWRNVFRDEFHDHITDVCRLADIFGFLIELSDDPSNPKIISMILRNSTVEKEMVPDDRFKFWLWEYVPHNFPKSSNALGEIYTTFRDQEQEFLVRIRDRIQHEILDCMDEAQRRLSQFKSIPYKQIYIPECNLPIILQSLTRLNDDRIIEAAKPVLEREYEIFG